MSRIKLTHYHVLGRRDELLLCRFAAEKITETESISHNLYRSEGTTYQTAQSALSDGRSGLPPWAQYRFRVRANVRHVLKWCRRILYAACGRAVLEYVLCVSRMKGAVVRIPLGWVINRSVFFPALQVLKQRGVGPRAAVYGTDTPPRSHRSARVMIC